MLCEEAGIKLNELATRSGVTPSTVYSMLEPSREDIYITTIKKLCDGLDISIAEFFDTKEFRELEQEIE
ncbi:MAG: helix-turn-helix transcriptional regulator [Firmicutes bacterium]|nr:helix-turn-helix transcriptional regulator [Bacillota bacterium]